MMFNEPIDLFETEIILAIQTLYNKKVSDSIETCTEIVHDIITKGKCERKYRKSCEIVSSTLFHEILSVVPKHDRKLYENHSDVFGFNKLENKIHVLRIYKKRKINTVIDITNNIVIYDADNLEEYDIVYNHLMDNVNTSIYKGISIILENLESEKNKKFVKERENLLRYDGLYSKVASSEDIGSEPFGFGYMVKYPNVEIEIDVSMIDTIYNTLVDTVDNQEPVLLAYNTYGDKLFIQGMTKNDSVQCIMYITLRDGEKLDPVYIVNRLHEYFAFNTLLSVLNDIGEDIGKNND